MDRIATPASQAAASGLLGSAAQVLRQRAAQDGSARSWRRLADTLRQMGDLEEAVEAYDRALAVDPGDAAARRASAVLRGEEAPSAAVPVRFLREPDFLPVERVAEVQEHALKHRDEFQAAPIRDGDRSRFRSDFRTATRLVSPEPLRAWLEPLVAGRAAEFARRMGLDPFPAVLRDFRLDRYGDGDFFSAHNDRGGESPQRVLAWIWYFWFPPRRFEGGELFLYDWDADRGGPSSGGTAVRPQLNQLVVLPAHSWHEILPVRCPDPAWEAARFTLHGWICRAG